MMSTLRVLLNHSIEISINLLNNEIAETLNGVISIRMMVLTYSIRVLNQLRYWTPWMRCSIEGNEVDEIELNEWDIVPQSITECSQSTQGYRVNEILKALNDGDIIWEVIEIKYWGKRDLNELSLKYRDARWRRSIHTQTVRSIITHIESVGGWEGFSVPSLNWKEITLQMRRLFIQYGVNSFNGFTH